MRSDVPTPPVMVFVGVSTGRSLINQLFPVWMAELGRPDAVLRGVDLPVGAEPAVYRDAVRAMAADDSVAGALVTTHKINVYFAAAGEFGDLDEDARTCREVSCIVRTGPGLRGMAKDPTTGGRALRMLTGPGYFARTGADLVCLGSGGAGTALVMHLFAHAEPDDRPVRLVVTDPDQSRVDLLAGVVAELSGGDGPGSTGDGSPELVRVDDAADTDRLIADAADGSVVVNATGMGKDRPGAPVTEAVRFPRDTIAWDMNYRGDLQFLDRARATPSDRGVRAVDGWGYFLHGWLAHLAEVYRFDYSDELFTRLARVAEPLRPR